MLDIFDSLPLSFIPHYSNPHTSLACHICPDIVLRPIALLVSQHPRSAVKKKGYLSEQFAPAHVSQDTSNIPARIKSVVDKHKGEGGILGPPPPNMSASGSEMHIDMLPGTRSRVAR